MGIEKSERLKEFFNHAIKIIIPFFTPHNFEFQITKRVVYNRYGSHEPSMNWECIICLDKKAISPRTCCGCYICQKCNSFEKCPLCKQVQIELRQFNH